MANQMVRRGPDAQGEWSDLGAGVAFGHRRLAIIDLDARANQPFVAGDGRRTMVFNGEIYNYQALRDELIGQGANLRTTSDTEVVLELYNREGEACFHRLRGMFAVAIWDQPAKRLVMARDPYGIKPLYYARTAQGLLFASQVKALLAAGVSATLDPAGVAGFHLWGSVPEPFTLYQEIKPAPPGAVLTFDAAGAMTERTFDQVGVVWQEPPGEASDLGEVVRAALASSVSAHLVADVPVAVLLSGGVDSGVVAALASEAGVSTEGVTLRFPEFAGQSRDETPRAQEIAAAYGLAHTVRDVTRAEFEADLPSILDAMDQPSVDGVNTWFATKSVAERGYKVALSGVGGDELFCGYNTFAQVPRLHRWGSLLGSADPLAAAALSLGARISGRPKLAGVSRFARTLEGAYRLWRGLHTPDELAGLMPADEAREGLRRLAEVETGMPARSSTAAVGALESTRYLRNQLLRDSDWASMAHSIELRTPLVDWTLLRALAPYAERFMDGRGKALMASAPRQPLPNGIVSHRKTGFGLPMNEWLGATAEADGPWARRWARTVAESFSIPHAP